jgi:hypothetical protein
MELQTITVPKGMNVVFVSDNVLKFLNRENWSDIEEPTIAQASEYCGYSVRTIKEDFKKSDCPLRISTRGKQGRGSQTRYHKYSVEEYKKYKHK